MHTKKIIISALKVCIFLLLANLPFFTVTQMVGIDVFLDSFENPDHYICFQDKSNILGVNTKNNEHILIQKSSHPSFDIKTSDSIVYYNYNGDILCNEVTLIKTIGAIKRYNIIIDNKIEERPIYENQIVGKIMNIIDDNIWNTISIKIWDLSVQNLNLRALFTED